MTSPVIASSKRRTVSLRPGATTRTRKGLLTAALGVVAGALVLYSASTVNAATGADDFQKVVNTTPHATLSGAAGTLETQRESGYYPEAGAPLVTPHYPEAGAPRVTHDAASTLEKQRMSGYYPDAGAPWVTAHYPEAGAPRVTFDAATTLEKQRMSGYYAEAGAPWVTPWVTPH
jgi:hypothetical protein